jgi:hypothetical protein
MKIKLWSNSAEGWFEKAFSVVWVLGIAAWVLYMIFSAWQIIHNQYQGHVKAAPFGWNVFGFVFEAAAIYWFYLLATDSKYVFIKDTTIAVISGGAVLVLGICGYAGFVF